MKILQNYLGKNIIFSTLLVVFAVLAVETFVNFVGELKELGQGDYGLFQALCYVLLGLPQALYQLFPMTAMLGVIVGLGALAAHHELIILQSSGVSLSEITWMVIKTALLMIIFVSLIGVFVAPQLTHHAERKKLLETSAGQAITTQHGTWLKDANSFIHIQAILPGGKLQGITRYDFSITHQLIKASFAKEANYDNEKHLWHFLQSEESIFFNDHIETKQVPEGTMNLILNPGFIRSAEIQPQELSLSKLYKFIAYQKQNGLHTAEYLLIFWQRLMQPIAGLVMIFLATPCVFGPLRSTTVGLRMLTGVAIGFGFYLLNSFFAPISIVYQLPPFLAASLPSFLFFAAGIFLMRKAR